MTEDIQDDSGKIDGLFDTMTRIQIQLVNCKSTDEALGLRSRVKQVANKLAPILQELESDNWQVSGDFMVKHIRACRWALVCNFGWSEKVTEYIDECQHQDGYGYWAQFDALADVVVDFSLYLKHSPEEAIDDSSET